MKRGVYSLGSQHTVTRNFIHDRGGPSSAGRAGRTRQKERFKYAAYLLNSTKRIQTVKVSNKKTFKKC